MNADMYLGKTTLSFHDYPSMLLYPNNPPLCQVPWDSLDLARVTAWGVIGSSHKCGDCLYVCGPVGCDHLLVVDQNSVSANHLDISTSAGMGIVGSDTGRWSDIVVTRVDQSLCRGIWDGRMFYDFLEPMGDKEKLVA